jgi:O-antigen ligase
MFITLTVLLSLFPVIIFINDFRVNNVIIPIIIILLLLILIKQIKIFYLFKKHIIILGFILIFIIFTGHLLKYPNFKFRTGRVRLVMWNGVLKALKENPILGYGIGTYQLVFPKFRNPDYHRMGVSHNTTHAHSDFLETFFDIGLVGGTVYFLCFFLAIYNLLYIMKKSDNSNYYIAALFISSIIGYYNLNITSVWSKWFYGVFYFWFIIGLSQLWCLRFKINIFEKPRNV